MDGYQIWSSPRFSETQTTSSLGTAPKEGYAGCPAVDLSWGVGQAGGSRRVDAAALGRLDSDAGCDVYAEGDLRAVVVDVDDAPVAGHVLDDDTLAREDLVLDQVGE